MTRDSARAKKLKAEARWLAATRNLPYALARRLAEQFSPDAEDEYYLTARPSREDLVGSLLREACEGLVGSSPGRIGKHGLRLNLRLPDGLRVAEVAEASPIESSLIVSPVERFEGGTEACSALLDVMLRIEGRMERRAAEEAEREGTVDLLELEPDDGWDVDVEAADYLWEEEVEVVLVRDLEVELEFAVTLNLDAESVEDVEFVEAVQRTAA